MIVPFVTYIKKQPMYLGAIYMGKSLCVAQRDETEHNVKHILAIERLFTT